MPIIIGGKVLDINEVKQQQEQSKPDSSYEQTTEFRMTPPKKIERKQMPKIKDGNTLIVNGKQKTIGRKSQYLLDMMIIDDE